MPERPDQRRVVRRRDADGHWQTAHSWESLVERQIREAAEQGEFDNLPNHGQPLPNDDNPYAADWGLAYHVLKNAGYAPPWIEADKEVRALLAKRDAILERAANGPEPSEIARRRDRAALEDIVAEANAAIARVNSDAPSPLYETRDARAGPPNIRSTRPRLGFRAPWRTSTLAVAVLALVVAACGSGNTTPPDVTPDPQTTSSREGRFELVFTVDRTTLRPGDAITGTAELWLRAPGSGALSGPGEMFGFEFAEVGGSHRLVAPVMDSDCSPHQLGADAPLTSTIVKSGVAVDDFSRTFLEGRAVHLPAGTWDITAVTWFHEGRNCGGLLHEVRATIRVVVNG